MRRGTSTAIAYIDYLGSWGPLIAGHAHPGVVAAIQDGGARGTSYGAPTEAEVELAELVKGAVPEHRAGALRQLGHRGDHDRAAPRARRSPAASKIVKFDGCYHGHADGLLVQAGSGPLTLGAPDSPGRASRGGARRRCRCPTTTCRRSRGVRGAPGRDRGGHRRARRRQHGRRAARSRASSTHLRGLTQRARRAAHLRRGHHRLPRRAAAARRRCYGVTPDLTCLGKIVGGGLPVGAYGGRRAIMEQIAPLGPVYQAGTLSGNPLAMAAGIATLTPARRSRACTSTSRRLSARLADGLSAAARAADVPYVTQSRRLDADRLLLFRAP